MVTNQNIEVKLKLDDSDYEKGIKKAGKTTDKFSKEGGKNLGLMAAGFVGITAAVAGTIAVTKKLVSETGQLETASVKWEVLLGSVSAADKAIKEVFEFSNSTPFTFKQVEKANATLFNLTDGALMGADALKLLGDRSAKANAPIEELSVWWGRMYSSMQAGRPVGEAMARMQELGVVSGKLRNKLESMSKTDMMNGTAWKVFIEGTKNADGMMEKLAQTIEGKLSTLSGVWDGIFAFEDKQVQDGIKSSIDLLINTLNQNKPAIQGIISDIFSVASDFADDWIRGAIKIYDLFADGTDELRNYKSEVLQLSQQFSDIRQKDLKIEKQIAQMKQASVKAQLLASIKEEQKGDYFRGLNYDEQAEFVNAIKGNDAKSILKFQEQAGLNGSNDPMSKQINSLIENTKVIEALNSNIKISTGKTSASGASAVAGVAGAIGGSKGKAFSAEAELEKIAKMREEQHTLKVQLLEKEREQNNYITEFKKDAITNLTDSEILNFEENKEKQALLNQARLDKITKEWEADKAIRDFEKQKIIERNQAIMATATTAINSINSIIGVMGNESLNAFGKFTGAIGAGSGLLDMFMPGVGSLVGAGASLLGGLFGKKEEESASSSIASVSSSELASATTRPSATITRTGAENYYDYSKVIIEGNVVGDEQVFSDFVAKITGYQAKAAGGGL